MARRYPFLSFSSGIDWKDVDPRILAALNRLGAHYGKTVEITSGYRTRAHQAEIWERSGHGKNFPAAPPGLSQHEHGSAADATIDGKPIASVYGPSVLLKYGIDTIYKGGKMFDPVHIQLAGTTQTSGKGAGAVPSQNGQQHAATQDQPAQAAPVTDPSQPLAQIPDLSLPQYQGPGGPPDPSMSLPQALPPGSVQAGGFSPDQAWQQIASQSLVSPESQLFAQRAQQVLAGGAGAGTS